MNWQLAWRVWRAGHQRRAAQGLIAMVDKAVKSKAWAEALEKNGWTPAGWPAKNGNFVDSEFASLRATMVKSGMVLAWPEPGRNAGRQNLVVRLLLSY